MDKKVNNFQEEFSIEDIEIARDVTATYDCGMSRIALKAPEQIYRVYRNIMKEPDSSSATIHATTLKMYYAIQVWCKAVLISGDNPSNLLYYWWLHWKPDDGPFNKIEYSKFYRDITVDQLLRWFWELLEQIADSGEIQVSEGCWIKCKGEGYSGADIICDLVLDAETGKEIDDKVKDVYAYPYNKEPRTYKWEEIKGFFYEMTLDQLRLTMPKKLHHHTTMDDILLKACSNWDVELIKLAMERGANINCLNEMGESVLQVAVEFYKDHDIYLDKKYSKEEIKSIEAENEKKCKEIVDLLLSYGADINLFGYDGMSPLHCLSHSESPEMVKFLLERGASPNANCYLEDNQYWPELKNVRSTILDVIDGFLYEDYNDPEREIVKIIRDAGGRQYVWDYTPWDYGNVGKYVVRMTPSADNDKLFTDNARWYIGSCEQLTVEDEVGKQTQINLKCIDGLKQWNADFQANITNLNYDWASWKKQGYDLACQVAKILPKDVALFYLYDNEKIVTKDYHSDRLYLCQDGGPIRIK